ncbi:hypothetical protein [Sphingomonas desiccabilis]|uniref:Uncharacterized protein n=1 Tax=Sphingomonas desiccabilis TaxID=429134 RepID=A0A4Q2J092_9SPHN|nr:hypothetical protein [Sphingomonas desiccabilis]MBB3910416.1 hypothetical protein [Sphingomonas desiccabilis]RXZ35070.1 hypothetical protein EO081_05345 [Sphingomonas desiccabilis]
MKLLLPLAAAAALVLSPGASAQKAKSGAAKPAAAKPAAGQPSREEVENASRTLAAMIGGLQSDKVPEQVKSALFACIYRAPLAEISLRTTQMLNQNKDKLNASNTTDRLSAVAAVCGVREAPPGAAPAAKKPQGR